MALVWIANDSLNPDASETIKKWRSQFVIGKPQAKGMSTEELEELGLSGLYWEIPDLEDDNKNHERMGLAVGFCGSGHRHLMNEIIHHIGEHHNIIFIDSISPDFPPARFAQAKDEMQSILDGLKEPVKLESGKNGGKSYSKFMGETWRRRKKK